MNKMKDFYPIIKRNLQRSFYVYNSTGYIAITTELYSNKISYGLYIMVSLQRISALHPFGIFHQSFQAKTSPKDPAWKVKFVCMSTEEQCMLVLC